MQPLVQWKRNAYYTTCVCICSLRYPACNALAPYCYLYPAGSRIFYTLSNKLHDFLNKSLNIKCVFRVSLQRLSEIFLMLRKSEREMIENVYWSSCEVHVILVQF